MESEAFQLLTSCVQNNRARLNRSLGVPYEASKPTKCLVIFNHMLSQKKFNYGNFC